MISGLSLLRFANGEISVGCPVIKVGWIKCSSTLSSKILFKNDQEAEESVLYYLKEAINSPLIYSLYLFSIQISIFILINVFIFSDWLLPWAIIFAKKYT